MSFLNYLIKYFTAKTLREERENTKCPCKYFIYRDTNKNNQNNPLNNALIVNISSRGFGMIISPPFENTFQSRFKKDKYKIHIEIYVAEIKSNLIMNGEIRWIRSIKNIKKPYSEMGIKLTTAEDDSRKAILNLVIPEKTE